MPPASVLAPEQLDRFMIALQTVIGRHMQDVDGIYVSRIGHFIVRNNRPGLPGRLVEILPPTDPPTFTFVQSTYRNPSTQAPANQKYAKTITFTTADKTRRPD